MTDIFYLHTYLTLTLFMLFNITQTYIVWESSGTKKRSVSIGLSFKETKSATMNIFRKKIYFLFESFVKVELSYVFSINLFTITEHCMET